VIKDNAKLVIDDRGLNRENYENGFFFGGCGPAISIIE